jgi:threonine aldolase
MGLAGIEGVEIGPASAETNIVRFQLTDVDAGSFVERAYDLGLWILPTGPATVRAVFYLDIGKEDVDRALEITAAASRAARLREPALNNTAQQSVTAY